MYDAGSDYADRVCGASFRRRTIHHGVSAVVDSTEDAPDSSAAPDADNTVAETGQSALNEVARVFKTKSPGASVDATPETRSRSEKFALHIWNDGTIVDGFVGACPASVIIPDSVTEIAREAFQNCRRLTSVTLPSTLCYIGEDAFRCSGITGIAIPEGVTEVRTHVKTSSPAQNKQSWHCGASSRPFC